MIELAALLALVASLLADAERFHAVPRQYRGRSLARSVKASLSPDLRVRTSPERRIVLVDDWSSLSSSPVRPDDLSGIPPEMRPWIARMVRGLQRGDLDLFIDRDRDLENAWTDCLFEDDPTEDTFIWSRGGFPEITVGKTHVILVEGWCETCVSGGWGPWNDEDDEEHVDYDFPPVQEDPRFIGYAIAEAQTRANVIAPGDVDGPPERARRWLLDLWTSTGDEDYPLAQISVWELE